MVVVPTINIAEGFYAKLSDIDNVNKALRLCFKDDADDIILLCFRDYINANAFILISW